MSYGPITLERWMRHQRETGEYLHVFLDGQDVTTDCEFADDVAGYVIVHERDAAGRRIVDRDAHDQLLSVRRIQRFGHVEILAEPNYPHD